MNQPQPTYQPPTPPNVSHHNLANYTGLHKAVLSMLTWTQVYTRYHKGYIAQLREQANSQVQSIGAALASGATLVVSAPNHHVTGTATVKTITPPSGFSGPLWLISDNGFSLGSGGNIADLTTPILVGKDTAVALTYDYGPALWYVSGVGSALTAGDFIYNEQMVHTGGAVWTITSPIRAGCQDIRRNGVGQSPGASFQYTISGQTVTFNAGSEPDPSDDMRVFGIRA